MREQPWASDVPVSMPEPLADASALRIPMAGFCFTEYGLRHDLTYEQWEQVRRPHFAPVFDPSEPEVSGNPGGPT